MVYRFFKLTSSHSCRFTSEATVSPLSSSKIEAAPKSTVFRQLLSRFSPLLFLVMPVSIVGTPQHNSKSYGNTTENNLQNKCFRSRQQTRHVCLNNFKVSAIILVLYPHVPNKNQSIECETHVGKTCQKHIHMRSLEQCWAHAPGTSLTAIRYRRVFSKQISEKNSLIIRRKSISQEERATRQK